MPYVHRDEDGRISGIFDVLQGGYAEEWLDAATIEAPLAEEPTLEQAKNGKLAELDDYRWQREIGGVQFAGMIVSTDSNSQQKIAAVYTMAKLDPDYGVPVWEVMPGVFMPLDNATIVALGEVVRQHIQTTFNIKAALYPRIQSLASVDAVRDFNIAAQWEAAFIGPN
ncbi:hypothetical protein JP74_02940 [Devosia sp. 17-2-E-8]|nr:hypothetical protein JP74_02940 [Devosia sp. 17-2-E-8]